jgi:hypothetical protein
MAKAADQDLGQKLRLRRILFTQGYWTPIEVELSQYENLGTSVKRRSLTDLDVLGIRYDRLLDPHRIVGDCKSGRNVADVGRLFWLRGVMDYFGADQAYFLRPQIDTHARTIAPKLGLRVLDDAGLAQVEKTLDVDSYPIPLADLAIQQQIADLWGIVVPAGGKPSDDQLKLKGVYSYLSYSYWYIERYRNLLVLLSQFEGVAPLLDAADSRHVLLCHVGVERFAHCLLDLADHVQAQGMNDVVKYSRNYLYGGPLALKEKERFFELLARTTGVTEPLDPAWLPDVLELLGRLLRNPGGAADVLRHLMAAYIWCAHLGNLTLPEMTPGVTNTPALVLAKDVAQTFIKATGIPSAALRTVTAL